MSEPDDHPEPDDDDLVAKGMTELPRNGDDQVDANDLAAWIAHRLPPLDVDAMQLRKAVTMIASKRRPGVTEPDGQLHLEGIDPYDYEPDRLVLSDDNGLVENHRAKPAAKSAEARRAMDNLRRITEHASRRQAEAAAYGDWALDQARAGAEWVDITFGRFVEWHRGGAAA